MELFRNPWNLLWIPLFLAGEILLRVWSSNRRKRWLTELGKLETLGRLYSPEASRRRTIQYRLLLLAVSLLLFSLAGPQWGIEMVSSTFRGLQVVVAVDTSLSMATEDVSPNRMEKAKIDLTDILTGLQGDRVGVIAFSGEAFIQCPLTTDFEAAKSVLNSLNVGRVPTPGTSLASALDLGRKMLSGHSGHKAMVLITDGEDHKGHSLEAAQKAAQAGIQVFIIGVGTPEGGPIPVRDPQGRITGYKKDRNGATVISRLGEDGLVTIAKASSGAYYRTTASNAETSAIVKNIAQMENSKILSGSQTRYSNRFRLPLAAAILLLILEMLVPECGTPLFFRIPTRSTFPAAILALFLLTGCGGEKSAIDLWRGNRDFKNGRFDKALEHYTGAEQRNPKDQSGAFNAGDAQYRLRQWDPAAQKFSNLSDPKQQDKNVLRKALYNLGNTQYQKGDFPKAMEAYRRCLLMDPSDEDCRFNLAKTLERMKNPNQSQKPKPPPPKPQDPQKNNKDNPQQKPPSSDRSRPQSEMSQEDAERILQAIREREHAAAAHLDKLKAKPAPADSPEVDW